MEQREGVKKSEAGREMRVAPHRSDATAATAPARSLEKGQLAFLGVP